MNKHCGKKGKYGEGRELSTTTVRKSFGVSLWRSIKNLWQKLLNKAKFNVGNGRRISLWEDNWLGQGSLKGLFPDNYASSQQQNATIEEV